MMFEYLVIINHADVLPQKTTERLNVLGAQGWQICGVTTKNIFLIRHASEYEVSIEQQREFAFDLEDF